MKNVVINVLAALLNKGATLEKIRISPDRSKVIGRMWDGHASVAYKEVDYTFELWHHGNDEETEESLQPHFRLKSFRYNDKYYDASWHMIPSTIGLWVHPTGWFRDRELAEHSLIKALPNRNIYAVELTPGEVAVLEALGFKILVRF